MDSVGDLTSSIGKRMKKSLKNCKRDIGEFAQSLSGFANLDTLVEAIHKVRHPEECASRQTNVVHTTVDWSKYPSASYRKGFSSSHNIHFELDPAEADDFPNADERDDADGEHISNQDWASSSSVSARAGRRSTLEEQRIYFNTNPYSFSPQRNPVSSKSAENIPDSKTSFLRVPTDEPEYRATRSKSLTSENDYRVLHLEHYYRRRGSAPMASSFCQDLPSPTKRKSAHPSSQKQEKRESLMSENDYRVLHLEHYQKRRGSAPLVSTWPQDLSFLSQRNKTNLSNFQLFHYRCNEDYNNVDQIQTGCCQEESEDSSYEIKSLYRRSSMK